MSYGVKRNGGENTPKSQVLTMKALITGATGFIGSRLAKKLTKNGSEVVCIVRKTSLKERIKELTEVGAKIYYGDVANGNSLRDLPTDVDVVYHLAALLDHAPTSYEPFYQANVIGTQNLVKQFLKSDVKKFVFMSSIAAIGLVKTKTGFINEDVKCNPTTFYGRSKYEAEKLLFYYFDNFKFPMVILRAPTVYGPSGKNSFLEMLKFVKRKIEKKRPIFYIDKGDALTSLCYVDNLIDALILAMERKCEGEIFHIADGRSYTNKEILSTISNVLGGKPAEIRVPKALLRVLACINEFLNKTLNINIRGLSKEKLKMLSTSMAFDISKAREYLGYKPTDNFEEFVGEAVAWYVKNKLL
jgi:nucleoside-diphosphate-sugar epimerase